MASSPTSSLSRVAARWGDHLLLKDASLFGGLELAGIDPKALGGQEHELHMHLARSVWQALRADATIQQFYVHYEGVSVQLEARQHPRSHLLSQRRAYFLNHRRRLTGARLFHLLSIPPERQLNSIASLELLTHFVGALTSAKSRQFLKERLGNTQAIWAAQAALREQAASLADELSLVSEKFSLVAGESRALDVPDLWALMRVLHTLNPSYFESARTESIPDTRWDALLFDGDVHAVNVNGRPMLKFEGAQPVYARLASLLRYGGDHTPVGFWVNGPKPPILQQGNFIIQTRFKALSALQRSLLFQSKENEIERRQFSFFDALKGDENKSILEKDIALKDGDRKLLQELDEAASLPDRWGIASSSILVFDENPEQVANLSRSLNSAVTQAGGHLVWESAGLMEAYKNFLPGFPRSSRREVKFNTSQLGACTHLYKSSDGIRAWGDGKRKEEALYIFESDDGVPFHYTPFIGGRCVVIGVGPIRSGKTFTKNTLASHFLKFGGYLTTVDIDPGAEPIAEFFGQEGGIFRVAEDETVRGFNSFSAARGRGDNLFKAHLLVQIEQMLMANTSEALRSLDRDEQAILDRGIDAVLDLPRELQSLASLADTCGKSISQKLARYIRGGIYGDLFDAPQDAIGAINKRISAFNLVGIKDDQIALRLAMNEIFFRVVRLFEDPHYRDKPKFLDMDEAHHFLRIPYAAHFLLKSIRTWGKYFGGVGLWSQSPYEFEAIPEWDALRSSATTLFFMADPEMDRADYQRIFKLKESECDAIASLIPKRQAFIVQREARIAKAVNLNVEAEQYVINTSHPLEAPLRRQMMAQYPGEVDRAIRETVRELNLEETLSST